MSTDGGLLTPKQAYAHLERLHRRADHLQHLLDGAIQHRDHPDAELPYVRAELAALRWAIPVLEAEHAHLQRLHRTIAHHAHPTDAKQHLAAAGTPP